MSTVDYSINEAIPDDHIKDVLDKYVDEGYYHLDDVDIILDWYEATVKKLMDDVIGLKKAAGVHPMPKGVQ